MLHVEYPVLAHLPALAKGHQALVNEAAHQGVPQQQQQGHAKDSHVVMFTPYHQRLCLSQTASPVASTSRKPQNTQKAVGLSAPGIPQVDAEQAGQEAGGQEQQRHHRHLVGAAVGRLRHQVVDLVRQHGGARHPGIQIVEPAPQAVGDVEQASPVIFVQPADLLVGQARHQIPLGRGSDGS